MIIRLPEKFAYNQKNAYAYVINGILYIEGNEKFEKIMYEITYTLKGKEKCLYCKNPITSKTRTIDHMNPRTYGGPSIPNNLLPCCKKCNSDKSNMTADQFRQWLKLETQSEKDEFSDKCIRKNFNTFRKKRYLIPKKWLTRYNISKIGKFIWFDANVGKAKYKKISEYYEKWHRYPAPIILSKNDWVLEGKCILQHAKRNGIKYVDALILENVIVKKNSK